MSLKDGGQFRGQPCRRRDCLQTRTPGTEAWLDLGGDTAKVDVLVQDTGINISAFGLDAQGQLYMLEWNFLDRLDKIYKVIAVEVPAS